MADNRPVAYWEDDVAVFRASGLDTCEKALAALLMDYAPTPPPKFLAEAFTFGQEHEAPVIANWLEQHPDWELVSAQDVIEYRVARNIIIRGHTDGRIKNLETGEERVLEVKTLGTSLFKAWRRGKLYNQLPSYGYQAKLYLSATGLHTMQYVVLDKATFLSAGRYDVYDETITADSLFLPDVQPILDKLERAYKAARAGTLPDDLVCSTSKLCPVSYLHDAVGFGDSGSPTDGFITVDGERGRQLGEALKEYRDAKDQEKELSDRLSVLREQIVELMADDEKVSAGGYRVTMVNQERKSIDKQKLAAAGLLEEYETSFPISYPRVTKEKVG